MIGEKEPCRLNFIIILFLCLGTKMYYVKAQNTRITKVKVGLVANSTFVMFLCVSVEKFKSSPSRLHAVNMIPSLGKK